jgi:hypothetical protein
MKFTALFFVILTLGCANQGTKEQTNEAVSTNNVVSTSEEFSSLSDVFKSAKEAPSISKFRNLKINRNSPRVKLSKTSSSKPFVVFQVGGFSAESELINIKTVALSLELKRVGSANLRLYVLNKGVATEIKPKEFLHRSDLGTCLTAYFSYDVKEHLKEGNKFVIVNDVDSFNSSLGFITIENPNLNLQRSVGFCTMVEIYPSFDAGVEVTIK